MNPLHYLTEGIWRDEAFSYLLANHSFIQIIRYTVEDFNPPLYYFLLHIWMLLFGSSEISLRSLSLLFYVLGVFCIYEIFRVIMKKSHLESAIFTTLCALNPLVFYYAFETRMYSMLFCLAMASSFYYFKKDRRNYTIVAVIGMYTHYFMGLVIMVQVLHALVPVLLKKPTLALIWQHSKHYIFVGLCFLPWALLFLSQNSAASSQYWIVPLKPLEMLLLPGLTYSGIEKDFAAGYRTNGFYQQLVIGFSLFFYVISLFGVKWLRTKKLDFSVYTYFLLMLALPLIIILLVMIIKPLYVPRYLIFVSAAISMVFVLGITSLKREVAYLLLGMFALFTIQFQYIQLDKRTRDTTKAVINKIKPLADPLDVIYVTTELDYMTAQYYYQPEKVFIYGKTYNEIPSYVGKVLIPPTAIVTDFPPFPRKAFVITGPSSYEVQSKFR